MLACLAVLLLGCPPIPTEEEPPGNGPDADHDGFVRADDCNDKDATIHPGGKEHCDGVDEDCDGELDNAAVDMETFWADDDADGYGDAARVRTACAQPQGYVADDGDCDDADAARNPGATEICDAKNVDEDCDGLLGGDDPNLDTSTAVVVYADDDGDGYGAGNKLHRCPSESGYAAASGDCDDADATHTKYCYDRLAGAFRVDPDYCVFSVAGIEATSSVCPDCEFAFAATATQTSGVCNSELSLLIGYEASNHTASFALGYAPYYTELGPWPATVSAGSGYDILSFNVPGPTPYYYYGRFYLYDE